MRNILPWTRHALCRGMDPTVFHPEGAPGVLVPAIERAKAICAQCPVSGQCLDFAVDNEEKWGIWGGKTGTEIKAIVARRKKDQPAAAARVGNRGAA